MTDVLNIHTLKTFNLWNPYLKEPDVLEFDVSPTEVGILNKGTKQWISSCLNAFEIRNEFRNWNIVPVRSNFYSDYPEENEWRDRWSAVWVVNVELENNIFLPIRQNLNFPIEISAIDTSAKFDIDTSFISYSALVIAEFRKSPKNLISRNKILDITNQEYDFSLEILTYESSDGRQKNQARIFFANLSYPECLPVLDSVREYLKEIGCSINWKYSEGLMN